MNLIALTLILFGVCPYINPNNTYCDLACKSDHVCCKYAPCRPSSECPGHYKRYEMLDFDRKLLLEVHNHIRNQIASGQNPLLPIQSTNMQVVTYSKELEFIAACWASRCAMETGSCMDSVRGPTSQTIWQVTEKKIYRNDGRNYLAQIILRNYPKLKQITPPLVANFNGSNLKLEVEALSQVLWAETRYFGCARVSFDSTLARSRTFHVVCVYFPRGKIEGDSIFKEGAPCGGCTCNAEYNSLCGRIEFSLKEDSFVPPFTLGVAKIIPVDLRLLAIVLVVVYLPKA